MFECFVPGRLCLFGEHSDWAGRYANDNPAIMPGVAIVTGVEQGIYARIEKADSFRFRTVLADGSTSEWVDHPVSTNVLKAKARNGGFFSYVAGVAACMIERFDVGGISIDCYKVTLPIKKGLSSSAAICVLTARAFNIAYNLHLSVRGEMEMAYTGEAMTWSKCGRLDQACAYGCTPVLMKFDGDDLDVEMLDVGEDIHMVYVDLDGQKDTRKILSSLNSYYPYAQDEIAMGIHSALGPINQRITTEAASAIRDGNVWRIGALMSEAQSVFDDMVAPGCPTELKSPKLHAIMCDPVVGYYALGTKGVGSQGDGMAQMVCADTSGQCKLVNYLTKELGLYAYPITIKARRAT